MTVINTVPLTGVPEQGVAEALIPPALVEVWRDCPLCQMDFSKALDQRIFLSTLLPSKYHSTFLFGEGYLTVVISL